MYPVPLQRSELRPTSLRLIPDPMGLCKRLPQTLLARGKRTGHSPDPGHRRGSARGHTLEKASRRSWEVGPTELLMRSVREKRK